MGHVNVVLFCGGRGSHVLSTELVSNPQVRLTLAINGYDDGLSTGEVRQFLGDCLGPSDFRKNASVIARALCSCSDALIDLLDLRFPDYFKKAQALKSFEVISGANDSPGSDFETSLSVLCEKLHQSERVQLIDRLHHFTTKLDSTCSQFKFSDCSIGNLVFAGCFLSGQRDFNAAVADYCSILSVPSHSIQNVTDGTNAYLVALDRKNRLIESEADIVGANRRNYIRELFIVDQNHKDSILSSTDSGIELEQLLKARSAQIRPNKQLLDEIAQADIIIYAPGTQHSSLLPSYLTPGIGEEIATNLSAVKILVTNIHEDVEIPDTSAIEIIERALYYLRQKNQRATPAPFLITHYIMNDAAGSDNTMPYVPLGRLQNIEDPRLVRISNFEDGISGVHNARKILTPFIETFLERGSIRKISIVLLNTESLAKISQTIIESARAGLQNLPVTGTFFFYSESDMDSSILDSLPFQIRNTYTTKESSGKSLLRAVRNETSEYTVLFDSSGMYRGEDIVNLISLLTISRLDAVWGSRRLSLKDIRESYHLRYKQHPVLGFFSSAGSHLLSIIFLLLYGRYVSDVLSGARAVRSTILSHEEISLINKSLNEKLLSMILRNQGDIFETPVKFFSLSPEQANRTTVWDGIQAVVATIKWRFSKELKDERNIIHPSGDHRIR